MGVASQADSEDRPEQVGRVLMQSTATQWRPYDEPPSDARTIRLRFDETGERDADGFYNSRLGGYFKTQSACIRFEPVHPKLWSEVADGLTR